MIFLGDTTRSANVAVIAEEPKSLVLDELKVVVHDAMPSIAIAQIKIENFFNMIDYDLNDSQNILLLCFRPGNRLNGSHIFCNAKLFTTLQIIMHEAWYIILHIC